MSSRHEAMKKSFRNYMRPKAIIAIGSGHPGDEPEKPDPQEDQRKRRSEVLDRIHGVLGAISEPEDLEKIHDHVRQVAADCLSKKAKGSSEGGEDY